MDFKEISLGEALEARIKALAAEVWDSTAEVYELNEANETHAKTCAALEVAVRNLTEALTKAEALSELRRAALEEYYAFLKGYVAHLNNDQITAACIELLELGSDALAATPSNALDANDIEILRVDNARLREALVMAMTDLWGGYWSTRNFIDENVPNWVRGDDGPSFPCIRNMASFESALSTTPSDALLGVGEITEEQA